MKAGETKIRAAQLDALLAALALRISALILALALLGGPTAAVAASSTPNPQAPSGTPNPSAQSPTPNPLSQFPTPPPPVSTPTSSSAPVVSIPSTGSSGSSTLSGSSAIAIAIGALVVLAGISLFIWRDARRRAPVKAGAGASVEGRARTGSKPPAKPRKLSPAERRRRKRGRARR